MTLVLVDASAKRYDLERVIASGGEGSIYTLRDYPNFVVKHYHAAQQPSPGDSKQLSELQGKIAYQLEHVPRLEAEPAHPYWTWPTEQLFTEEGDFVAYLMAKIEGIKGEEFIQFSSGFDWRQRVQAALKLVHLVQATHEAGYIIGDLNPRNLFFSVYKPSQDDSELILPTLTDTDSFQINDLTTGDLLFKCTVQNPEYSAPELINAYTFDRSVEQDYFTLAIVLFQILSLGVHPFSGTVKSRVHQEIKDNISKNRNVLSGNVLTPPRGMIDLDIFPNDIFRLFDKTFRLGHTVTKSRTRTDEWETALATLLTEGLTQCQQQAQHHYSSHYSSCPWCAYEQKVAASPFHPALRNRNATKQNQKVLEAKIINAPTAQGQSAPVQTTQKIAAELRAEIGNNSFFGPIPDALRPGQDVGLATPKIPPTVKPDKQETQRRQRGWLFRKKEANDVTSQGNAPRALQPLKSRGKPSPRKALSRDTKMSAPGKPLQAHEAKTRVPSQAKEALKDVQPHIDGPDVKLDNVRDIGSEKDRLQGQITDLPRESKAKVWNRIDDKLQDLARACRGMLERLRRPQIKQPSKGKLPNVPNPFKSRAVVIGASILGLLMVVAGALFIGYRLGSEPRQVAQSDAALTNAGGGVPPPISLPDPTSPSNTQNEFLWPVQNIGKITSCFGERTIFGAFSNHKGLDIGVDVGTPVIASRTGLVEEFQVSTAFLGYGTYVILRHSDGMKSLYGHLSPSLNLTIGQQIQQGQPFALSGNTGYSTGPHLHFEVIADDTKLDPAQFLSSRLEHASLFKTGDDTCWGRAVLGSQN